MTAHTKFASLSTASIESRWGSRSHQKELILEAPDHMDPVVAIVNRWRSGESRSLSVQDVGHLFGYAFYDRNAIEAEFDWKNIMSVIADASEKDLRDGFVARVMVLDCR